MNISFINAVLTVFILAYVYSAVVFMSKQKRGADFTASFDKAIVRGGCFFLIGSGLSFVVMMSGNFSPGFI